MFDTSQLFGATAVSAFYTKTINQSLRFEDGDGAYLRFTPTIAGGDAEKGSISLWVKRGNISTVQNLYSARTNADATYTLLFFQADNTLKLLNSGGASLVTNAVFRDSSAWYHIVLRYDTADATAADRAILYVNGVRQTVTGTNPTLNENFYYGYNGRDQSLGTQGSNTSQFLDSYLAEVHFTNGTAYTADTFGELKSGIWIPKSPSVTYGTNGFKLTFEDSAAIGDDTSGNGNDWTVNNLVASDVVPDSPTNNFNVMNPALYVAGNNCTYSEGNLKVLRPVANWETVHSTMAVTSGKWYWEVYLGSTNAMVGICDPNTDIGELISVYTRAGLWNLHLYNGDIYPNGAAADTTYRGVATGTTGDVISVALDADNGRVYFGKNGTWFNSGDPAAGTGYLISSVTTDSGFIAPTLTVQAANDYQIINFGQDDTFAGAITSGGNSDENGIGSFKYTVPSGFLALCTSNLPNPAIDPAQDDPPENYVDVLTYTGDGSASNEINGLTFQPDWVWIKARNVSRSHVLFDSVRGVTLRLRTDGLAAESDLGGDTLLSFDSDGFTYGADTTGNGSGDTFVAWNWKAGGAPTVDNSAGASAIPTAGSVKVDGANYGTALSGDIAVTRASANTEAGFSIVEYTGTQTAGDTVDHFLGAKPEMIIVKNMDSATTSHDWIVYHHSVASDPATDFLQLNNANILADSSANWDDTEPTSIVFSLGNGVATNDGSGGGERHIAYIFRSIDQYSKCGVYTGNGNSNGSFIYTGFRPRFLLTKNISGATADWRIYDSERLGYNASQYYLVPNTSNAEVASTEEVDFLSNGFKCRDTDTALNTNNVKYIYLAFAEQPFKYSNAR